MQTIRITSCVVAAATIAACAGVPPPVTDSRVRPASAEAPASPRAPLEPARLELPAAVSGADSQPTTEEPPGHRKPAPEHSEHEEHPGGSS